MSDLERVGNLAVGMLFIGSLAVWGRIARGLSAGRIPLEYRPRTPPGWQRFAPVAAVLSALLLPALLPSAKDEELWLLQRLCLISLLQIIAAFVVLSRGEPFRPSEFGLETAHWRDDIRLGTCAWLASLLPVYAVNLFVMTMGWRAPDGHNPLLKILLARTDWVATTWVAVVAIVGAPLAEEFLFRVVIQGALERHVRPRLAILISSAVFAMMHYEKGRPDFLPLFPLALILGYTYYRLHSFWAVLTIHALFNATTFCLSLLEPTSGTP